MKYPKQFEQYWKRAGVHIPHLEPYQQALVRRAAYNAWRNGKKIREYELDMARSNGAFKYIINDEFKQRMDAVMQEFRNAIADEYDEVFRTLFEEAWYKGTKVKYHESS